MRASGRALVGIVATIRLVAAARVRDGEQHVVRGMRKLRALKQKNDGSQADQSRAHAPSKGTIAVLSAGSAHVLGRCTLEVQSGQAGPGAAGNDATSNTR